MHGNFSVVSLIELNYKVTEGKQSHNDNSVLNFCPSMFTCWIRFVVSMWIIQSELSPKYSTWSCVSNFMQVHGRGQVRSFHTYI